MAPCNVWLTVTVASDGEVDHKVKISPVRRIFIFTLISANSVCVLMPESSALKFKSYK